MTKYTIQLLADGSQFTAYDGASLKAAQAMALTLRATLITTRATATIYVRYNGAGLHPVWDVVNGSAQALESISA